MNVPDDRAHLFEEAIRLAADIGERGLRAINDFMDRERVDIDRVIRLSGDSVTSTTTMFTGGADQQDQAARQQVLQELEGSIVRLVREVAPHASLAMARIVTGDTTLRDHGWHTNTVTAMREVARLATSLINDSVGADGGDATAARGGEPVELDAVEGATSISIEVVNEHGPAPTETAPLALELVVTPLTCAGHVVLVPTVSRQLGEAPDLVELALAEGLRVGTYRGWIYATSGSQVLASTELQVKVSPAASGTGTARP
jgi:hypothetical protein